jgi:hypothetical protein
MHCDIDAVAAVAEAAVAVAVAAAFFAGCCLIGVLAFLECYSESESESESEKGAWDQH